MTAEDQLLVAKAALAGVRFWRGSNNYWVSNVSPNGGGMLTLPRAAAHALFTLKLWDFATYDAYDKRTAEHHLGPQDVDLASLAMALDADLPDAP